MLPWPTILTISRVVLTLVVIYSLVSSASVFITVVIFAVAALTDYFDGVIARRWNLKTRFGAKADMVADRFLWAGTALAILFVFEARRLLISIDYLQLAAIMTREVVAAPFALIALGRGRAFPPARRVAKITTGIQGFALPAFLLSTSFPMLRVISIPLAAASAIYGFRSAMEYIRDSRDAGVN